MAVFHLKYRPQKIGDLDLVEVSRSLKKILENKEIPQAFLFAGPKGAGKTSAARIVAKTVNCTNLKDGEPCGKCDNCREITNGSCIDIIEMDGASNRGIEDIRALKDKVYLSPSKLSKKVFIIDEVHMLTKEAFNALLKLIEEPPKHTIFILCTTDAGKIPETVLSRLIKINFYKGSREELRQSLTRVIEGEKVKISQEAVEMLLDQSDGSFRNLQKTFNEIVIQYGGKLDKESVVAFFNSNYGEYSPDEMEKDLLTGDTGIILTKLEKIADKGIDFKGYREKLIMFFQERLLAALGVIGKEKSAMELPDLKKWLELLILAGKQEKEVSIDQLPLQLAVAEFLKDKFQISNVKFQKEPKIEEIKEEKVIVESKVKEEQVDLGLGVEKLESDWGKVLQAVKPFNHSVEAFLRAARPKSILGRKIILQVFYPFHKDKLEEEKNRAIVEKGLAVVFGVEMQFECVLGNSKQKPLIIKNDTPVDKVSEKLAEETGDIYDVAKQIFG